MCVCVRERERERVEEKELARNLFRRLNTKLFNNDEMVVFKQMTNSRRDFSFYFVCSFPDPFGRGFELKLAQSCFEDDGFRPWPNLPHIIMTR